MAKRSFAIDASNSEAVKSYIWQQFAWLSWWPTEGPAQAKAEFEALLASPEQLTQWCEKWLDAGQWRQLKNAVDRSLANPPRRG